MVKLQNCQAWTDGEITRFATDLEGVPSCTVCSGHSIHKHQQVIPCDKSGGVQKTTCGRVSKQPVGGCWYGSHDPKNTCTRSVGAECWVIAARYARVTLRQKDQKELAEGHTSGRFFSGPRVANCTPGHGAAWPS